MKSCGTCKWWDVENQHKCIGFRIAACNYPVAILPASHDRQKYEMRPCEGQSCPCYEKRD